MIGENNWRWKGDQVGYDALHRWVAKQLGKPNICYNCGLKDTNRQYDWANISGNYIRDLNDWIRLCKSCHVLLDITYENSGIDKWIKAGNHSRGMSGKNHSEETKKKISLSLKVTRLGVI